MQRADHFERSFHEATFTSAAASDS